MDYRTYQEHQLNIMDFVGKLRRFEHPEFDATIGVASSMRLAKAIALNHPFTLALKEELTRDAHLIPAFALLLRQYSAYECDPLYGHPRDHAAFACLVLMEEAAEFLPLKASVRSADVGEWFSIAVNAAREIPRTWWTRHFIEAYDAQMRCRHCGRPGHDDTGMKPGPFCRV